MNYLQIFQDKRELLEPFTLEEKGELLDAMMQYAFDGTEPVLQTNARYIWAVFRQMIDKSNESYQKQVSNGNRGGRPKTQAKPNETQQNPTITQQNPTITQVKPNETQQNHYQESRIKNQDIYTSTTTARAREEAFTVEPDAPEVQMAMEAHRLAAQYRLDKFDDNIEAILADLKAYGTEKVTQALRDAAQSDNRNGISVVYYRAVLKNIVEGKPKLATVKSPPTRKIKAVTEAAYDQRTYEDDNSLPEWMREKLQTEKAAGSA